VGLSEWKKESTVGKKKRKKGARVAIYLDTTTSMRGGLGRKRKKRKLEWLSRRGKRKSIFTAPPPRGKNRGGGGQRGEDLSILQRQWRGECGAGCQAAA